MKKLLVIIGLVLAIGWSLTPGGTFIEKSDMWHFIYGMSFGDTVYAPYLKWPDGTVDSTRAVFEEDTTNELQGIADVLAVNDTTGSAQIYSTNNFILESFFQTFIRAGFGLQMVSYNGNIILTAPNGEIINFNRVIFNQGFVLPDGKVVDDSTDLGGGGGVMSLQAVTDVDNSTTNWINAYGFVAEGGLNSRIFTDSTGMGLQFLTALDETGQASYVVNALATTYFQHVNNPKDFVFRWYTDGIGIDSSLSIGRDQIKIMKPLVGDFAPSLQSVTDNDNETTNPIMAQNVNIGSTGGNLSVQICYGSGHLNSGYGQTVVGNGAGYNNSGDNQSAFGLSAGQYNSGDYQAAVGNGAGGLNTGSYQSAFGYNAGQNNSGNYVNAFGAYAAKRNDKDTVTAFGPFPSGTTASNWYSQSISFHGQYPNGKKTFNLPAGYQIFIGGVNKSAQWDAGGGSYDDSELRDSIRLAFTEIDAIGGGAADGVATAGAFDLANSEIDVTVASPGTSFSIDVSGMLNYTNLTNTPTIPTLTSELTNDSGFLTSEVDAVFVASDAYGITATDISNWNAAFAHISNTSNPHSVTPAQVGAYTEGEVDALLGAKADKSNTYTKTEVGALVDANKERIDKLFFERYQLSTSRSFETTDIWTRQYNLGAAAVVLTIPLDFTDMEAGDQIILQAIGGDIVVDPDSGVTLTSGSGSGTVSIKSPCAARVLEKIGINEYVIYDN